MKKSRVDINLFEVAQTKNKSRSLDKIRTTDVNILLNRVRLSKKNELKKKIVLLSLLFSIFCCVVFFSII